jgi:hypothetical protein
LIIRKNISLEDRYVEMIQDLTKKHQGNFSAAVRDVIELYGIIKSQKGSVNIEDIKSVIDPGPSIRDNYIDEQYGLVVPVPIFRWFLENSDGVVPKVEVIQEPNGPAGEIDLETWGKTQNTRFDEFGIPVKVNVLASRNGSANVSYRGLDPLITQFSATWLSLQLIGSFRIETVEKSSNAIFITYTKTDGKTEEEENAYKEVVKHFGKRQELFEELKNRPGFWNRVVTGVGFANYDIIFLTRDAFENLFGKEGHLELIHLFREALGKPIQETPLEEFLIFFKEALETNGLVTKVDFEGDRVIVYHGYTNDRFITILGTIILRLLNETGHDFELEYLYKTFIFRPKY